MARTARIKKEATGTAHYHLMSRANDRRFLFEKGKVKDSLVDALKRAAEFSGVGLEAYAGMDNHFHVVCRVERTDEPVPEGELVRRVGVLKGAKAAARLAGRWEELRGSGGEALVEAEQARLRSRPRRPNAWLPPPPCGSARWTSRRSGRPASPSRQPSPGKDTA